MLIDPAETARVPETTAQRVLVNSAPTATVFHVMVHVHSVMVAQRSHAVKDPRMVSVPRVQIVKIDPAMEIAPTEVIVQAMVTALSAVTVLLMEHALIGESVLVMAIVKALHVVIVPAMVIVMALPVVTDHNVLRGSVLPMVDALTVMTVLNAAVIAAVVHKVHPVANAQVMTVVAAPLTEIVDPAPSARCVLMEINHNGRMCAAMATGHNAVNAPTVIALSGLKTAHMETVQSVLAMETAVVAQIVQVLLALEGVILVIVRSVVNVLRSLSSLKNRGWRASFVWFAPTTTILGLMMMSLMTCSTRQHAMS
ncbi:non-ribosomal peptide synthetase [Aurantimicrobium minutum]|uniref:Non-ribosomal peptide synthetase n=1 Tax=Aurantimicrobium minutum TaxID=708131 RepID=A0A173LWI9_9MICO|nr:non-ribosomal peptide synthetase [Aurantimicrobium minutum]